MHAYIDLYDGKLTDESTCTINGMSVLVPVRTANGGTAAVHRVWAAIKALGHKPATNYYGDITDIPDGIAVKVIPA